jgi:hypothetical protein
MSDQRNESARSFGRSQRGFAAALAVWIFFSPSLLPALAAGVMAGGRNDLAIWDAWIAGGALALLALAELVFHRNWHLWSIAGLGIWIGSSPWILDFQAPAPRLNAVLAGSLLTVSAVCMLLQESGYPQAVWGSTISFFQKIGLGNARPG